MRKTLRKDLRPRLSFTTIIVGALLILIGLPSRAQSPAARPEFEVASIKPSTTNEPRYFKFTVGDDRFRGTNISLKDWIKNAWAVTDFEMAGAPQWISSENFDIDAKAERPIRSVDEGYQMLKSLLEDRFSLTLHRETRRCPCTYSWWRRMVSNEPISRSNWDDRRSKRG